MKHLALTLALAFLCIDAHGQTLVNTAVGGDTTGSTFANFSTNAVSTTATNSVIACARVSDTGITLTWSDTALDTFVSQVNVDDGSTILNCSTIASSAGNASNVYKITPSSGTVRYVGMAVRQYSGANTGSLVDVHASTTGAFTGGTITSSAYTTTSANEVAVVFATIEQLSVTYSAGTGFGNVTQVPSGASNGIAGMEDRTYTSTQSGVTAPFVTTGGNAWIMAVVTLKASSGGGGVVRRRANVIQ